jgi:DNA recombination-dependent growth factor C
MSLSSSSVSNLQLLFHLRQEFLHSFQDEKWRNKVLNADDDNFVTRWLVSHQWKTWIQYGQECEVETTLENGINVSLPMLPMGKEQLAEQLDQPCR